MKKSISFFFVLAAAAVMAACSGVSQKDYATDKAAQATQVAGLSSQLVAQSTVLAKLAASPTLGPTASPTLSGTPAQAGVSETENPLPTVEPTLAPTATATQADPSQAVLQLRTATEIRSFGRVLGWVTGGDAGQYVQGAQIALKQDFALKTLPDGFVFEVECVHYLTINGEVVARPVCDGALVRFGTTSVVPAETVGTLWSPAVISGSETEKWAEGFLNKPCQCPDGDCRDE